MGCELMTTALLVLLAGAAETRCIATGYRRGCANYETALTSLKLGTSQGLFLHGFQRRWMHHHLWGLNDNLWFVLRFHQRYQDFRPEEIEDEYSSEKLCAATFL